MPGFDAVSQDRLARATKQEAARLGFEACGIFEGEPVDEFERCFEANPVKRATFDRFKRNVRNALQNALDRRSDA